MSAVDELRSELELRRTAEVLGCDVTDLDALQGVDADELAVLRRGLAHGLTRTHGAVFDRFATAATLVPASLAARISRAAIGPALAGRMAGSMSGRRAAAIMGHLDTAFLADACRTLSVEAAAALLPAIPRDRTTTTATELLRRRDFATLGRFVDALDDATLLAVLALVPTGADLLRAGAAAESGAALDRVVALLDDDRRRAVVTAVRELPVEGLSVAMRIGAASRAHLARAVGAMPEDELVALLDDLTQLVRDVPAASDWAATLPGEELAAVARTLDRSEPLRSAAGRLTMAALGLEDPS